MTAPVAGRAIALLVMAVLGWKLAARGLTMESSGILSFIRLVDLVFHEAGHVILSPLGRFLKFYVFRFGFLDGRAGYYHILIGCMASFLKYAKLIALNRASHP